MKRRVILCPNPSKDVGLTVSREAKALLESAGFEVKICPEFLDGVPDDLPADLPLCELEQVIEGAALVVSLGGDGTIMHTARRMLHYEIPIIGVNLDRELRPASAGVISVNAQEFHSGKTLDKILRLSFRNDAFTCIADLSPTGKGQSDNKKEALTAAFHTAIEEVFRSSVKGWRAIIGEYVLDNTDFLLRMLPEIEFISKACDLIDRLQKKAGCTVTMPKLLPMKDKAFRAAGLYNPRVALMIDEEIVTNDFAFDEEARIYVLTGPNRGGKSVITVALGAAEAMCMLGLPVPATEAEISPVDAIFTHFPEGADDTIDKGRLGEECARLREIFDGVTENSMILLDESLSSTGAYEASYIASEILTGFAAVGCRGIFSTHLHELAAKVPEINEKAAQYGGVRLDTLVAGIEEGRRSFKIYRAKPDGRSYARDIADKYGLAFDDLLRGAKKSKPESNLNL